MFRGAHESYILWYIFYTFLLSVTNKRKQKICTDTTLKRKQSGTNYCIVNKKYVEQLFVCFIVSYMRVLRRGYRAKGVLVEYVHTFTVVGS